MSCSANCCAIEAQFNAQTAKKDLDQYHSGGPDGTTRVIIEALRNTGVKGSLLDIGAGIGVLQHELLDSALSTVTHVEASSAYINVARQECERHGHAGRAEFLEGDFVELAQQVSPATVVALDRVICCYRDAESLISASVAKCEKYYAFSVPHDRWYVQLVHTVGNLVRRLCGNGFQSFVHPISQIEAPLRAAGLEQEFQGGTFIWYVALWKRPEPVR